MKKHPNAEVKATLPLHANPYAHPTTFYSAINPSTKLLGTASLYVKANVEFLVSPSKDTIYLFASDLLNATKAFPYAFLVDIFASEA